MKQAKTLLGITIFSFIELGVGSLTLGGLMRSFIEDMSTKPPEVIVFVMTTAFVSLSLGIGLLRHSTLCYRLLLYFSTVIILSKILIFARIISLSGALETAIPSNVKNIISVVYHCCVLFYFTRPSVKRYFRELKYIMKQRKRTVAF